MNLLDAIGAFAARRPWLVLAGLALTVGPTAYLASNLGLESSFTALLPESYPAVRDLRAGIERTGGSAFAVVALDARDRPRAEALADVFAERLASEPYVRYVQARLDLDYVKDRALLYLSPDRLERLVDEVATEIDRRTVDAAGLGLGLAETSSTSSTSLDLDARFAEEAAKLNVPTEPFLVGKDGRYLYVFVALRGDTGNLSWAEQTQAALEKKTGELRDASAPGLELRYSGSLIIRLEDNAFLVSDLGKASTIGFLGVVLLLVAYTRRLRTLILLSLPLFVGLTWTFAFAWLAIGRLNIISGFLASILSGLGIEFGIHLMLRYLEERGHGLSIDEAQAVSFRHTGRSLLGSALTNAGAFGVVSFAGFEGFSEFGVIAAGGMLLTLAATLLGFPALNMAMERIRPMKVKPLSTTGSARGIHVPRSIRAVILVLLPVLAVYSVYALAEGQVRFRTNWREIKGESAASDFDDYIIRSLGGSFTQSLILVDDQAQIPRVVDVLARHQATRKAAGLPLGITGHFSVDDLVPRDQPEKLESLRTLARQLERVKPERLDAHGQQQLARAKQLAAAQPFDLAQLPRSLTQRLLTQDGRGSLITLRTDYLFYESSEVTAWAQELTQLREELTAAGVDAPIISENWIAGTVFQVIIGDGPFILLATILVVFFVVLLDFRSLRHASWVMGSLLLGQLAIAGAMGLLGVELNFINAAVLPIIVGVSIDNAVHIYHRYLEEGPASIPLVLRHTASATTLSSATNLMGFGAMIVAHHKGLRSVAELAMTGVALTFFSTSLWFPLVLEWWGERRPLEQEHRADAQ